MKKSIGAGTFAAPSPVWVVGTYDSEGKPNMMTAAWGGICCSRPPCIYVSLRAATYSHGNIVKREAYTVSVPGEEYWKETDYVGVASGRDTDKFEGINYRMGETGAPVVLDNTVSYIEARVTAEMDVGTHTIFIGEVVNADMVAEHKACMTYDYYHQIKGGKTPKAAATFIEDKKAT